ncbi:hypothetical protein D3C74_316230 [compost metagenome]
MINEISAEIHDTGLEEHSVLSKEAIPITCAPVNCCCCCNAYRDFVSVADFASFKSMTRAKGTIPAELSSIMGIPYRSQISSRANFALRLHTVPEGLLYCGVTYTSPGFAELIIRRR